jgi:lysophospholipase L1-like esterase
MFGSGSMPLNVQEFSSIYSTDALHPNDKGHEILASKLGKFLENL